MAAVLFFIAAIGAITGAIGVIALKNPFYSVLALVGHLLSLAALFLLLRAEFVAFAQVVVYAGAVMVLYIFVVSYVGGENQPLGQNPSRLATMGASACGLAIVVELFIAVLGTALKMVDTRGPHLAGNYGSPHQIGTLLLTRFLAPFEIASYLLLVAAIGAVVLARRRGGLDDPLDNGRPTVSFADFMRPRPLGTGTMAEGIGRLEVVEEEAPQ
jgi:NADH-quinone oxidoreductase subunit J